MQTNQRPLRIALVSYRSRPHVGGQGIYLRHISRELAALGHHVEVFSGQPYPELDEGPVLREIMPGWTPDEVQSVTGPQLMIPPDLEEMTL